MALTLVATAGAINANSYATLAEANTYHTYLPQAAEIWEALEDDTKAMGLVTATRMLDERMIWPGYKVTQAQALRWPRSGVEDPDGYPVDVLTIPTFLKNATAELARYLCASDRFKDLDDASTGIDSVSAGSVSVKFDKMDRKTPIPDSVMSILQNYTLGSASSMTVPLLRV